MSLNNLPKYEVGDKKEMANINGLFDAAKMFELFAIEVCNVWFEQKFSKEAM